MRPTLPATGLRSDRWGGWAGQRAEELGVGLESSAGGAGEGKHPRGRRSPWHCGPLPPSDGFAFVFLSQPFGFRAKGKESG